MDERRLYIGQLLRNYMNDEFPIKAYTVDYRFPCDKHNRHKIFNHNEGINFVIQYIRELEKRVDELQYIERIIKLAKEEE